MYDWPEVHWAHDALWDAIASRLREQGIDAPGALDRTRPFGDAWLDPGLVLSQTCGYPFSTQLIGKVRLVATPIYDVEGCEGPYYSTFIVARREEDGSRLPDFARRRFGFNSRDSLSGHLALRVALHEAGIDPKQVSWIETGGHRASIRAVAEGSADIASIDSVCWALAREHAAEAVLRLKVVAQTPLRPGLPFLTATRPEEETARIRSAIEEALDDPATGPARAALHLSGIAVLAESDYLPLAGLS
jgi:ABC-type phosphate/phosphonate transport system substrate-binding protein